MEHRHGFWVQMAQGAGEAVAERGLLRGQAGGVEFQARAGDAGEGGELIGVVPDEAEKRADLMDEAGGGGAAAAVFQGGEIGGGDQERGGHIALADAAGGAQGAEFFAEGGHQGTSSPGPLSRGSAPAPRWGRWPQTPGVFRGLIV